MMWVSGPYSWSWLEKSESPWPGAFQQHLQVILKNFQVWSHCFGCSESWWTDSTGAANIIKSNFTFYVRVLALKNPQILVRHFPPNQMKWACQTSLLITTPNPASEHEGFLALFFQVASLPCSVFPGWLLFTVHWFTCLRTECKRCSWESGMQLYTLNYSLRPLCLNAEKL